MVYLWVKTIHVLAIISWMAGMLYLPRLFVYHVGAKNGGELSETLKIMERRLLRYIINPAMIVSLATGAWLLASKSFLFHESYMQIKLAGVFGLVVTHIFLARARRMFARDQNQHSAKFFRILNEVPTVFMVLIIIMVIIHPWS
jgi:putative membrane protein